MSVPWAIVLDNIQLYYRDITVPDNILENKIRQEAGHWSQCCLFPTADLIIHHISISNNRKKIKIKHKRSIDMDVCLSHIYALFMPFDCSSRCFEEVKH